MTKAYQIVVSMSFCLLFFFHTCIGGEKGALKTNSLFEELLQISYYTLDSAHTTRYANSYQKSLEEFKEKQSKGISNRHLLEHLFYKVHRQYLKAYQASPEFSDIFKRGEYSCLTGTALYSLFLSDLGFKHDIVETTYHVFITIDIDDERFAFEATDAIDGFIDGAKSVEQKLKLLRNKDDNYQKEGKYKYQHTVQQKITFTNLIGLQYYNQAISAYNQGDFNLAMKKTKLAQKLHPSERLNEFTMLISQQLLDNYSILEKK